MDTTLRNDYFVEYTAWANARARCTNQNDPAWDDYGGRGITMAAEFVNDFAAFLAYIGPKPDPALTLERLDNSKGYERGNIAWVSWSDQMRNRRPLKTRHSFTYKGQTKTIAEWADELGIERKTLRTRLSRGLPLDRAFTPGLLQ